MFLTSGLVQPLDSICNLDVNISRSWSFAFQIYNLVNSLRRSSCPPPWWCIILCCCAVVHQVNCTHVFQKDGTEQDIKFIFNPPSFLSPLVCLFMTLWEMVNWRQNDYLFFSCPWVLQMGNSTHTLLTVHTQGFLLRDDNCLGCSSPSSVMYFATGDLNILSEMLLVPEQNTPVRSLADGLFQ